MGLNIKYNNGKENKEGRNLRKVRNPLWSFPQKGRQEIRNHTKSQIRQSIQWQGERQKSRYWNLEMQEHRKKDCRRCLLPLNRNGCDCQDHYWPSSQTQRVRWRIMSNISLILRLLKLWTCSTAT